VAPAPGLPRALDELDRLLQDDPELRARFFRLRIVDDATEFLKG
jgi:hypothetical protein